MITNFGLNSSFYCLNGHEQPLAMTIKEGNNQFYACCKYMVKDDKHPDGYDRDLGEVMCTNRLSFDDAGDIIMKFSEIYSDSILNGEMRDWTGYKFKVKRIDVKVLRFTEKHIDFGVVNRKVVKDYGAKK